MRVNRQIRVPKVRLIDEKGELVGVVATEDARRKADQAGLDLVEVVPTSNPPVCKILDYGKFRYDQTKRTKEQKKSRTVIKIKEIKLKPNIDQNDLSIKRKRAHGFLDKGNKVKVTCVFRGRENAHPEIGFRLVEEFCKSLDDVGAPEIAMKKLGRNLTVVIAPKGKKG